MDAFYIKMLEIFSFISTGLTMVMVGKVFSLLLIVWMVLSFLKAHRDPKSPIDIADLIVDGSGKIGGSKMRLNLAFVVCTWVLVYYSLNGQLSEWLFAAYLGAFVFDRMKSRDAVNGDDIPLQSAAQVATIATPSPAIKAVIPVIAAPAPAVANPINTTDVPDFVPVNLPESPKP